MSVQSRPEDVPYGFLDRALHRVAFASLESQRMLGEVENRICGVRADGSGTRRPVFVTSLPRAGTTVMLNLLASLPEFATATYRHMPFILSPIVWDRVSRAFRRSGETAERAHGDGVQVNIDSPEAFEEVLWMAFWPEHYGPRSIQRWGREAAAPEGFVRFFRQHMAKIVAAPGGAAQRYLSKNNANIARIGLLERLFPDAAVVVPFRNPWAQVSSLMRQHRRFSDLHAREPFARRYMESIGHFEFGEALRPIAFADTPPDPTQATGPEFWIDYWCDAYEAVLAAAGPRTMFVDHDALSSNPQSHLPQIAAAIGIERPEVLSVMADQLRAPAPVEPPDGTAARLERAAKVHAQLRKRAIVSGSATQAA